MTAPAEVGDFLLEKIVSASHGDQALLYAQAYLALSQAEAARRGDGGSDDRRGPTESVDLAGATRQAMEGAGFQLSPDGVWRLPGAVPAGPPPDSPAGSGASGEAGQSVQRYSFRLLISHPGILRATSHTL